jgi:hypothetical protein
MYDGQIENSASYFYLIFQDTHVKITLYVATTLLKMVFFSIVSILSWKLASPVFVALMCFDKHQAANISTAESPSRSSLHVYEFVCQLWQPRIQLLSFVLTVSQILLFRK